MTDNERFEEKELDAQEYQGEEKTASLVSGIGAAIVTFFGFVVVVFKSLGGKDNKA